nr:zinc finger CCCH domain-containing protein 18-like [Dasypus novemcinctus]
MDVTDCPVQDLHSPEWGKEEQQCPSEDNILRESRSDQDLHGVAGSSSNLETEGNTARGLGFDEEDQASLPKSQDQDSDAKELGRGTASSCCENDGEDCTTDPGDETSTVTVYVHESDFHEVVPEEPISIVQNVEDQKDGGEDIIDKGEEAPGEEEKPGFKNVEEKEPLESAKEKKQKEGDDGEIDHEIDDDDLEEGEVREPSDRKVRPPPISQYFMKEAEPPLSTLLAPISNSIPFRGQVKGNCTWGMNCRFLHPGVNDKGNYSLISKGDLFLPNTARPLGPHSLLPASPWGGRRVDEILPPPPPKCPAESAWERGLRQAKEVLKKATLRKEREPDFEEKRLTAAVGEDEGEFNRNEQLTRDVRNTELEFHTVPYYDYDAEWCWRGGQYENFRVLDTETEPYPHDRHREKQRERERENKQRELEQRRERWQREREHWRELDEVRQRRKEQWERERAKWDDRYWQHRDSDRGKEQAKEKEKPKSRSPQLPSSQAEPLKKAAAVRPQVKRAEEWTDPWRRSKSPRKRGVSVSPRRARRSGRTSVRSSSTSGSSRSSSGSSSCSGSGWSRSPSRQSSYSSCSCSSCSSRPSSSPGSRSRSRSFLSSTSRSPTPSPRRPLVEPNGELAPLPGKARGKVVKKPVSPPAPALSTNTPAPVPRPAQPGQTPGGRRKQQPARSPPRKRLHRGSGRGRSSGRSESGSGSRSRSTSASSVSSGPSTRHSVASEDRYRDLGSPPSLATSRSPTTAQAKKEKGKSKKTLGVKEDKRKRDTSTQAPKSRNPQAGSRSPQLPLAQQEAPPGQAAQGALTAHREIKLILLNKVTEKGTERLKLSDEDKQSPPPAKRPHTAPARSPQARKSGGRLGSPKLEQRRGQSTRGSLAQPDRKSQGSSQAKSSSKVTIVPGKAAEGRAASAACAKPGKARRPSRREALLKQLQAVEDAIARKLPKA